eukprot:g28829.t1
MLEEEDGEVEEVAWGEGAAAVEVLLNLSRGDREEQPATGRSEMSVARQAFTSTRRHTRTSSCATTVLQGDIYALGGSCPDLIHSSAEHYNLEANSWMLLRRTPQLRGGI